MVDSTDFSGEGGKCENNMDPKLKWTKYIAPHSQESKNMPSYEPDGTINGLKCRAVLSKGVNPETLNPNPCEPFRK